MFSGATSWSTGLNDSEVLIGVGGMVYALEKRGYVKAGLWTPECADHPEVGQSVITSYKGKLRASPTLKCIFCVIK